MPVVGIDLAGKKSNPTGLCILDDKIAIETVYTDKEIVERIYQYRADKCIVAIDAPLMNRETIKVRLADRLLRKYGALPPTMKGMRSLVLRASNIVQEIEDRGYRVIEVFPTASAKILGVYDRDYRIVAGKLGIDVNSKHELDAYLCALTGKLFLEGKAMTVGNEEGMIVIPVRE